MDDLEKAILFSFDQSGAVAPALRAQAQSYCEQARKSQSLWRLCLEKITSSPHVEVRFWCLQCLEESVNLRYQTLAAQDLALLRQSLVSSLLQLPWHPNELHTPSFLRNKLAQVLALLVKQEYPATWTTPFVEVLSGLERGGGGPHAADMFCRFLNAVDEEIVSQEFPRSPAEAAVATHVKDALRQQCAVQLADAWLRLVVGYETVDPSVSAQVLDTARRYVPWMDVSLFANERWIPVLFRLLSSAAAPPRLRSAASDCLQALLAKKMEPAAKLALLQALPMAQVCGAVLPLAAGGGSTAQGLLLVAYANELLECCRRAGDGADVATADRAGALLEEAVPAVLRFLEARGAGRGAGSAGDGGEEAAEEEEEEEEEEDGEGAEVVASQFLNAYVAFLKRRQGGRERLSQIFSVVFSCVRYDARLASTLDAGGAAGEEQEARMGEKRRELFTLVKNVARLAGDAATLAVQGRLASTLADPSASFADVEAVLAMAYQLGETAALTPTTAAQDPRKPPEASALAGSGSQLLGTLLGCCRGVPHHGHRLVALLYLEVVVRYGRVVQLNPGFIPPVLTVFLGEHGARHPDRHVSGRACYLLARLTKALRPQLLPYLDSILQSLNPVFASITAAPTVAKAGSVGRPDSPVDERIYAFEAVGLLLGQDNLPQEKTAEYLGSVLLPLVTQAKSILDKQVAGDGHIVGGSPDAVIGLLLHIISAMSYVSKGFGEQLTASRPKVAAHFLQCTEVVVQVITALPRNKGIRTKVISYLHRMVDTLGTAVFPFLPPAIDALLLPQPEVRETSEFVQFVSQLTHKFKAGMVGILVPLLNPLLSRVFSLLPTNHSQNPNLNPSSSSNTANNATEQQQLSAISQGAHTTVEEQREREELLRVYLAFLQALAANDVTHVFVAAAAAAAAAPTPSSTSCSTTTSNSNSSAVTQAVIAHLLTLTCNHHDTVIRKNAMAVWLKLISDWCAPSDHLEKVPGFSQFVIEQFFPQACILAPLQPSFDLRDANTLSLLSDMVAVQRAILHTCGPHGLLMHLATVVLPAVHCPPNLAEEYCLHLQRSSDKELRVFLKALLEQLRTLQQQHGNGNGFASLAAAGGNHSAAEAAAAAR